MLCQFGKNKLVRRYKICHFPLVVSYLCIGPNLKDQPNLVLYLVRRSKIFVSIATLVRGLKAILCCYLSIFSRALKMFLPISLPSSSLWHHLLTFCAKKATLLPSGVATFGQLFKATFFRSFFAERMESLLNHAGG